MTSIARKRTVLLKGKITEFLEKDECSRVLPGKKDVITKRKLKKQKRLLNDSLANLHQKFKSEYPRYKSISYTTFCRYRPFWVLPPTAKSRETCLCILHENISLMVRKLRILNIINHSFPDQLCKHLCCHNELREDCLSRNCEQCKDREIELNAFDPTVKTVYKSCNVIKEKISVKGQEKICQRTVKEEKEISCGELINLLKENIPKYMLHLRNINHQYSVLNEIKRNLSGDSALIHMDFSENYQCKYTDDVQSAHFGPRSHKCPYTPSCFTT